MPAPPPPRTRFARFVRGQGWTTAHAGEVLGMSQASIARICSGVQDVPEPLVRLVWLLERYPELIAELEGRWGT